MDNSVEQELYKSLFGGVEALQLRLTEKEQECHQVATEIAFVEADINTLHYKMLVAAFLGGEVALNELQAFAATWLQKKPRKRRSKSPPINRSASPDILCETRQQVARLHASCPPALHCIMEARKRGATYKDLAAFLSEHRAAQAEECG